MVKKFVEYFLEKERTPPHEVVVEEVETVTVQHSALLNENGSHNKVSRVLLDSVVENKVPLERFSPSTQVAQDLRQHSRSLSPQLHYRDNVSVLF